MALAFVRNIGLSSHSNVGATASKSFAALPAVGNLITVRVTGWHNSNYTATVPTDNQGNTYTQRATQANSNSKTRVYLYDTVVATSSGTFTIQLNNVQSSGNYINWTAVEHSGASATPFDVAATATAAGATTTVTATTASTAQADELVVGVFGSAHNQPSDGISDPPTTGYTSRSVYQASDTIIGHESADKIVSATGAQSATWTYNSAPSSGVCCAVATYKQAAANDIDGDLSVTLDAQTLSADGTVAIEGVAEVTQDAQTLTAEGETEQPVSDATPTAVGGVGKRRRILFEVWKNVPLYEADTVAEAAKVVKSIKRQAIRKANQAYRAGEPLPELPQIQVHGDADMLDAITKRVAQAQEDMALAYQRLAEAQDEEDIEVLLLQ